MSSEVSETSPELLSAQRSRSAKIAASASDVQGKAQAPMAMVRDPMTRLVGLVRSSEICQFHPSSPAPSPPPHLNTHCHHPNSLLHWPKLVLCSRCHAEASGLHLQHSAPVYTVLRIGLSGKYFQECEE